MSLDLANHIVDVIMSYEDPSSSDLALKIIHVHSSSSPDIQWHKLNRATPHLSSYNSLFKCHDDSPFQCIFSLECDLDLTSFFKFISDPSCSGIVSRQHYIQSDIVWFQTIIHRFKEQVGNTMFRELYHSALIDFSIKCLDDVFEVVLNFSKHSLYLGKNVHFEFHLDMAGNFKSVNFRSYTYGDNYQREVIPKFKQENQLVAFHLFLSYYCHPLVHQELDNLISVPRDLNDGNIHNYENIMNMIKL